MNTYSVALIGCGQMGEAHISRIYYRDDITICAVCDSNKEQAKLFAKKYSIRNIYTDAKSCIENSGADIIIIATYPSSHIELLQLCLENGKHVLLEKPVAVTDDDISKFARLVTQYPQCKVLIGYILRHNKTYQKAAELIQNGEIGSPIIMRMVQNHHTMDWQRYKRLIEETSPIFDCGVHYIDIMRWFTGEKITQINGIGLNTADDLPDGTYNYGMITCKLSGGSVAYYEAGWTNTISAENVKEFVGPKGRLKIIQQKDRLRNSEEGDLIELYRYPQREYTSINVPCDRKPCGDELNYLIEMIEKDLPPVPSYDEIVSDFHKISQVDKMIKSNL